MSSVLILHDRRVRLLTFAFLSLQAMDILTTFIGLRLGVPEGNPVVVALLQHSEAVMFGVKALSILVVFALLMYVRTPLKACGALMVANLITGVAVASNAFQIGMVL